jgi:hypothetical protein
MNTSSVAQALIEARNAPPDILLAHLAHPRPVTWSTLFEPVAKRYNLQAVSFETWFSKLAESASDVDNSSKGQLSTNLNSNPAVKLLSFFRACDDTLKTVSLDPDRVASLEAPALARLDVTKCATLVAKESLSVQMLKPLGQEDMLRWIGFWESVGFLPGRVTNHV